MAIATMPRNGATPSPLARALALGKSPIGFAALFSLVSNLLYLALPIYTTQVYSRVLSSQSGATLFVLTVGAAFVFLVSGIIDHFRNQVLTGFGVVFDNQLASLTFSALFDAVVRRHGTRAQALRDLDAVRQTISGPVIGVLFDLPWIPLFFIVLFVIDPIIGGVTMMGGVILLTLAVLQERGTRHSMKTASDAAIQSYSFTEAALKNGDIVRALGMLPTLGRKWIRLRRRSISSSVDATEQAGRYGSAIHYVRMLIQILTVAIGAWLVIDRKIPASLLFANMILSSRALAPIERAVGSWKALFEGVQSYRRLEAALSGYEPPVPVTQLPRPTGLITVEQVNFAPAGAPALVLINLALRIAPGEFVGVIGPSGAGKSSFARLLVGIWKPNSGHVRLDGADVYTWDREDFGLQVAYQPQDTELFAGTVRDNIARFRDDATDDEVVRAAQAAGAHDLILRLKDGYDTELSEGGAILSSGQRQRVGLARTLYGNPKVIVLDEPNANLDAEGEAVLAQALGRLKQQGTTIILITHKMSILQHSDKLLFLRPGQQHVYGPRDSVLQAIQEMNRPAQAQQPRRPAQVADAAKAEARS